MDKFNIPNKMKAVILPAYNSNIIRAMLSLRIEEKDIPKPGSNQVLIKIEAAPCNPSDIAFIRGLYNIKKTLPCILGFEGSGTVVDAGNEAQRLLGKRVSCFAKENSNGTWAEYFIAEANNCIIIKEKMDIDQAACFSINPFTAYGLLDIAKQMHTKGIIQNAASGQIGNFIQSMAKKENIKIINIVRKDEHIKLLKKRGEEYVLNSQTEDFEEQLTKLAYEINAVTAFDAVGGEITGQIINAMPPGSKTILYGGLSGQPVSDISTLEIIFKDKTLTGFNLNEWVREIGKKRFNEISLILQNMIISGEIRTEIQGKFKLEDVVKAIRQYITNMSEGKILFKP
ncbi:MAG: zinc-binding dehydrogenase [Bacteroidales bacterium]|nr:zinc-binding dehydrogenase [Bacteroidales bacterium]